MTGPERRGADAVMTPAPNRSCGPEDTPTVCRRADRSIGGRYWAGRELLGPPAMEADRPVDVERTVLSSIALAAAMELVRHHDPVIVDRIEPVVVEVERAFLDDLAEARDGHRIYGRPDRQELAIRIAGVVTEVGLENLALAAAVEPVVVEVVELLVNRVGVTQ